MINHNISNIAFCPFNTGLKRYAGFQSRQQSLELKKKNLLKYITELPKRFANVTTLIMNNRIS